MIRTSFHASQITKTVWRQAPPRIRKARSAVVCRLLLTSCLIPTKRYRWLFVRGAYLEIQGLVTSTNRTRTRWNLIATWNMRWKQSRAWLGETTFRYYVVETLSLKKTDLGAKPPVWNTYILFNSHKFFLWSCFGPVVKLSHKSGAGDMWLMKIGVFGSQLQKYVIWFEMLYWILL